MANTLAEEVVALSDLLAERRVRVVFAESCTAGFVAASLSQTAGISDYLCGSAVTYREATKTEWLHVKPADLERHSAVSEPVAERMAFGVLEITPEAQYAAAVTGHLGPDAPDELDGVVYIATAVRGGSELKLIGVWRHELSAGRRIERQQEAAALTLSHLRETIAPSE